MRLGFSSIACPEWDIDTIIQKAGAFGYGSVELCGLQGQAHLPAVPALASDPAAVAERFRSAGVELVCLGTENSLDWADRSRLSEEMQRVRETIELAGKLGAKSVRVLPGRVSPREQKQATLLRIAGALRELAPLAAANGTTLLIENAGEFTGSRDLWFILDAASHPAVRCCWDVCQSGLGGESASLSVPRLSRALGLTHIVDARLRPDGGFEGYALPGEGTLGIEHVLDLLRGVRYDGDLIFTWPRRFVAALADADTALPAAAAALKAMLDRLAAVKELTAYKGDKYVPKYAASKSAR